VVAVVAGGLVIGDVRGAAEIVEESHRNSRGIA